MKLDTEDPAAGEASRLVLRTHVVMDVGRTAFLTDVVSVDEAAGVARVLAPGSPPAADGRPAAAEVRGTIRVLPTAGLEPQAEAARKRLEAAWAKAPQPAPAAAAAAAAKP